MRLSTAACTALIMEFIGETVTIGCEDGLLVVGAEEDGFVVAMGAALKRALKEPLD